MAVKDTIAAAFKGNVILAILTTISVVLILVSFILPPTGVIDPSVLGATGEIFAFAALWAFVRALEQGKKATLRHNETEVTIEDEPKQEENEINIE